MELSRSWWEGLQKASLWWRDPAQPPSTGCFPALLWAGLPSTVAAWPHLIHCLVGGKRIIEWQFRRSLLLYLHAFLANCCQLQVAKRAGKRGGQASSCFGGVGSSIGTEDLFNTGCWQQYFSSLWGLQVCSSERCFSLHSVVLDSSYLIVLNWQIKSPLPTCIYYPVSVWNRRNQQNSLK